MREILFRGQTRRLGEKVWMNEYGDYCFYITNGIAVEMEDLIYHEKLDVEVIGNIHDNPELLKGGE